jgi:hypothetical protein
MDNYVDEKVDIATVVEESGTFLYPPGLIEGLQYLASIDEHTWTSRQANLWEELENYQRQPPSIVLL